jgi:alkaline phosphatase D
LQHGPPPALASFAVREECGPSIKTFPHFGIFIGITMLRLLSVDLGCCFGKWPIVRRTTVQKQTRNHFNYYAISWVVIVLLTVGSPYTFSAEVNITHGPLVGAVQANSAKIWVRTDSPADVHVEYNTSADFIQSALSQTTTTTKGKDFTGKLRLSGLAPETDYFYRLWLNNAPLPEVYSFRTNPGDAATRTFSLAVLSDFHKREAPVYSSVASDNPAFVIFLGDFDHSNPSSLEQMRSMHRALRGMESAEGRDFMRYIRQFPFYHVWDDHDFGINNADKTFPGKQNALRAFREYFPTPSLPSRDGIWHKFRYAQAEFFMLDLRSQRDPNNTQDSPNKSLLGIAQKEWLKSNLVSSDAQWKFLMSSVPFNPTSKPLDSWAAFHTEQLEIINFISQNNITGVIIISGDLHTGGAADDGSSSIFPEMSVPHANIPPCTTPTSCQCHTAGNSPGLWSEGLICGIDNPGYGFITVTGDAVTLQVKGADGAQRLSLEIHNQ